MEIWKDEANSYYQLLKQSNLFATQFQIYFLNVWGCYSLRLYFILVLEIRIVFLNFSFLFYVEPGWQDIEHQPIPKQLQWYKKRSIYYYYLFYMHYQGIVHRGVLTNPCFCNFRNGYQIYSFRYKGLLYTSF